MHSRTTKRLVIFVRIAEDSLEMCMVVNTRASLFFFTLDQFFSLPRSRRHPSSSWSVYGS